jgi:membrane dipeptidase
MIENEVDRLDVLYGFGVRQIGIAYSEANTVGSGLKERGDGSLTYFGERAVRRMNQLGLAIDISHSGDRTSTDVIQASTKPVFITHCGSREVWPTARMEPDAVIKACAECFYNIIGWLVSHGYSDDEIRAVTGGNILRVLEEVWV